MVQFICLLKKGLLCPKSNRLICDDTGGGCARRRKFPWSMSDFKPGDYVIPHKGGVCALTGLLWYLCGENFCNSVRSNLRYSGFKNRKARITRRRVEIFRQHSPPNSKEALKWQLRKRSESDLRATIIHS